MEKTRSLGTEGAGNKENLVHRRRTGVGKLRGTLASFKL